MRIATVLSPRDLPAAELQVGVLDGELVRVGDAYCAIDTIIGSKQRAASIAAEVPGWAIAERLTAAWIYGLVDNQPRKLQLCVTNRSNVRPLPSLRCAFREVVISEHEIVEVGGLSVTTPLRTALDFARIGDDFSGDTREIVRGLASLGRGFSLNDCMAAVALRRNLPNKRVALDRLNSALGSTAPGAL